MLEILLPPDTEAALRQRASANGEDVTTYAARLLKEALDSTSVENLLAPLRKQVEVSGVTDLEIDELGEQLRNEVWQEQRAKRAKDS